jgi:transcriptional regulator with XRE-family HTH domain
MTSARLQHLREIVGWSRSEAARRAGLSEPMLRRWENPDSPYQASEAYTRWIARVAEWIEKDPPPDDIVGARR